MTDIDPYKILGVSPEASLHEVKNVFRLQAQKHHPDKGGNAETYQMMGLAYKMIHNHLKKGKRVPQTQSTSFIDLRQNSQNPQPPVVKNLLEPRETFNQSTLDTFNQRFLANRDDQNDYLMSTGADDYRENRTKEQLLAEQARVETELGQIKPIFADKGQWNQNAFNQAFEYVNGAPDVKQKAMKVYEEPEELVSGLQPFTEIDDNHRVKQSANLSSLGFGDLGDSFAGKVNPDQIDQDLLRQLSGKPDITKIVALDSNEARKRMNSYQNMNISFHPKPDNPNQLPDALRSTKGGVDQVSKETLDSTYSQKLRERNLVGNPSQFGGQHQPHVGGGRGHMTTRENLPPPSGKIHQAVPFMDYPRNSDGAMDNPNLNLNSNLNLNPISTYVPAQLPVVQPHFYPQLSPQVPNVAGGSSHLPYTDFAQIQRQLADLQNTVRQQNQVIQNMTSATATMLTKKSGKKIKTNNKTR